jgi:cell division protein FtsN
MARDYQRRANPKSRRKKKTSTPVWKWLLVILLVALFIAFLAFMRPQSGSTERAISPMTPTQSKKEVRNVKQTAPVKIPAKTKPRFEFYTKLPEIEVIVPESEIAERRRSEGLSTAEKRQYTIQAGAFRQIKDADRRKAELAMLGVEPRIEKIQNGSSKWNRVIIGPYTSMRKIDGIRSRLRKNRIDTVVLTSTK